MHRSSLGGPLRTLLLVLLFLSPLLGVALVRRGMGGVQESFSLRESGRLQPLRAQRPSAALLAELGAEPEYRLVLRFEAAARVRVGPAGELSSLSSYDLGELPELARRLGASFQPLIQLPAALVQGLERRAAERSDSPPVDLLGMHWVELPGAQLGELEQAATQLQANPLVSVAYLEVLGCPPPEDPAPATPDYSGLQGYRASGAGMDAEFANRRGYRGAGISVSDCEYGWNASHEELHHGAITAEPGQTPDAGVSLLGYDSHGTAVAGLIKAAHEGFGLDGIAPEADFHSYPEWTLERGFRRVEAIVAAALGSTVGDVLLLEMQTVGPGGNYGPAEIDPLVWSAVRVASDAGLIVVAAAGNGAEDLDAPGYQAYRDRGHSGAILVGAGSADESHARLGFSSFGQRVDLQAWGQSVFTSGYGAFAELGADKNQRYTSGFGGTSSAAALVAGAVAVLQSAQVAGTGRRLDAPGMLRWLQQSGAPQLEGEPIGPAPQLRVALESQAWVGRVLSHNGTGSNPEVLSSAGVPRLGLAWQPEIELSRYPAARGTILALAAAPLRGLMTRYGELLVDLGRPALAVYRAPALGGLSSYNLRMPTDSNLIGLSVFVQGVIIAAPMQLTNSLEARLGH